MNEEVKKYVQYSMLNFQVKREKAKREKRRFGPLRLSSFASLPETTKGKGDVLFYSFSPFLCAKYLKGKRNVFELTTTNHKLKTKN